MSNVLSLSGRPVEATDDGKVPVPEVVERLEDLLAQAKRGDVRGIAVAIVRPDFNTSTMFEMAQNDSISHQMMAAICYLQHRYATHKCDTAELADGVS